MTDERQTKRQRNIFMGLTIFFGALSFLVKGNSEEGITYIMWRDQPILAVGCVTLAAIMGFVWWRATRSVGRLDGGGD